MTLQARQCVFTVHMICLIASSTGIILKSCKEGLGMRLMPMFISLTTERAMCFREMYLDGLNMVQTYIYWNLHEPRQGQEYDFSGNKNWTLFVEEAAKAGLFVNLRIGPFVASEWDYGQFVNGFPCSKSAEYLPKSLDSISSIRGFRV